MSVFIISNSILLTREHIDSLGITGNDIVMTFNHSWPSQFLSNVNHISMLRWNKNTYWGLIETLIYKTKWYTHHVVFINGKHQPFQHLFQQTDFINTHGHNIKIPSNYPRTQTPTSGFLGLLYTQQKLPTFKPILVGFTGENSKYPGKPGNLSHNYHFEQQYYIKNHIKTIYNTNNSLLKN